ncbi:MAG: ArdC family protein [Planctomycetota bacterium]
MSTYHSESAESTAARNKSRVESCTRAIVERFERGDLPTALAPVFIRRKADVPCRKWSWRNQLLTALAGFDDARTYLQWKEAGRHVKAGEHAFYIL